MTPHHRPGWYLPERATTPEDVFQARRRLLKTAAAGSVLAATGLPRAAAAAPEGPPEGDPTASLYPVPRNDAYGAARPLSDEDQAVTYNNYYEFGSSKTIWRRAQDLPIRPWTVRIDGLVAKPRDLDIDDLIRRMPLEERVYRHRCVEAWSMTVPWSGFPLARLVDLAEPLSDARYLVMTTFERPDVAQGQRASWYPWPYVEGLTLAEARHELAFLATGLYGKPIPKQNGAPLRLVVPWKYGFKSTKGIVRITFARDMPKTFWAEVAGHEYGFWANVNPDVDHPRWSQASERLLGEDREVPTRLYNGYADQVAGLYTPLKDKLGDALYR